MNNILVAFYSHSGITKTAAGKIHAIVGGDLFEIADQNSYPQNYNLYLDELGEQR